jgi:hypothetical protein
MKKKIVITGLTVVAGITLWFTMQENKTQEQAIPITPKEEQNISMVEKNEPPKKLKAIQSVKKVTQKEVDLEKSLSFETLDPQAAEITIKKKSKVEPISGFTYEQGAIKNIEIGDRLLMPDIENIRYELKVTQKRVNIDGSVTIETTVENGEPSNYAIITETKNATFVTLRAPGIVYEMEGIGGTGYIYSALEIKRAKIDYSVTDAVIPPKKGK